MSWTSASVMLGLTCLRSAYFSFFPAQPTGAQARAAASTIPVTRRSRFIRHLSSAGESRTRSVRRPDRGQRANTLPAGLDGRLELGAELLDGVLHRPAGAVGQAADGRAGNDAD